MAVGKKKTIAAHMARLAAFFPKVEEGDAQALYKLLRALEKRSGKLAEAMCNTPLSETIIDRQRARILDELDRILDYRAAGFAGDVFLNLDPRGYALKINDAKMRELWESRQIRIESDWGGYGIIAPEF